MTSDLDAKEPAVHLNEHNPERDIPGTHTAPQPGNDPSGTAGRLIRLAQQLEDQHAPMHMTIMLRAVDAEVERLRAAALALYSAGLWECRLLPEGRQIELWTELRDALGLPKGTETERAQAEEIRKVLYQYHDDSIGTDRALERIIALLERKP